MHVIDARNVNNAYEQGISLLREWGERAVSKSVTSGEMLVSPSPVLTVYHQPTERVLFDARRDANPFFHLFESLWMIGGRDDAAWLDQFVRDFGERYAEPDGRIHGAYGRRWRDHFWRPDDETTFDQLDECVRLLTENPLDRQAVIQMWNAEADLGVPGLRDRPCNTQVYLRRRMDHDRDGDPRGEVLDLTVTCRSNDIVYGAYGANAVHFSVLQEYLAARIGVGVGVMYQFSNNWHGYTDVLDRVSPAEYHQGWDPYQRIGGPVPLPMFTVPDAIDDDVERFLSDTWDSDNAIYANSWFITTALPMRRAHSRWRGGDREGAARYLQSVAAEDWRIAALDWLDRRAGR